MQERRGTPAMIVMELDYQGHLVLLAQLANQVWRHLYLKILFSLLIMV